MCPTDLFCLLIINRQLSLCPKVMFISNALLVILILSRSNGVESQDIDESRILLFIYYLTSDQICTPEMLYYNFTNSVAMAVRYVRSLIPISNKTFFFADLQYRHVHGCSLMEDRRGLVLVDLLRELEVSMCVHHLIHF